MRSQGNWWTVDTSTKALSEAYGYDPYASLLYTNEWQEYSAAPMHLLRKPIHSLPHASALIFWSPILFGDFRNHPGLHCPKAPSSFMVYTQAPKL